MTGTCIRCGQTVELKDGCTVYHSVVWPGSTSFLPLPVLCPGSREVPLEQAEKLWEDK